MIKVGDRLFKLVSGSNGTLLNLAEATESYVEEHLEHVEDTVRERLYVAELEVVSIRPAMTASERQFDAVVRDEEPTLRDGEPLPAGRMTGAERDG